MPEEPMTRRAATPDFEHLDDCLYFASTTANFPTPQ